MFRRTARTTFPHISRFTKHVKSGNEWAVVTDKNLRVLSSAEGESHQVRPTVINKLLSDARKALPEDENGVYMFHSHAKQFGINSPIPSAWDVQEMGREQSNKVRRDSDIDINIKGEGVMTGRGITVVKMPTDRQLNYEIHKHFSRSLPVSKHYEELKRGINPYTAGQISPRDKQIIYTAASEASFADTLKEYPEVSTRFIKREIIRPWDVRPRTVVRPRRPPAIDWDNDDDDEDQVVGCMKGKYKKTSKRKPKRDITIEDILSGI
jgi:hypothetical protein